LSRSSHPTSYIFLVSRKDKKRKPLQLPLLINRTTDEKKNITEQKRKKTEEDNGGCPF